MFTALRQALPADPLVMVYNGSLRLLEAQHTWALWKKNSLSKQGIELLDRAVAAAPANPEVRFVRGATERELPGFFGRRQQSKDDMAKLANELDKSSLEPRLVAAIYYDYGLDCAEAGKQAEAVAAWKKSVSVAPESHSGQAAARKLKALP